MWNVLRASVAAAAQAAIVIGPSSAAAETVAMIGLEAIDVGPLRHARIIEGSHYLRANAYGGRINYHLPRDHARD